VNFTQRFIVKPGQKVRLKDRDASDIWRYRNKRDAERRLCENTRRLDELQQLLYAEGKHALLVVLQGMDAAGKDATIRHVMSGVNPQGCRVTSFKTPTPEELAHDFLWRIHKAIPARGEIGIFNRSHYEDVLIVRVHNLVPKSVWSKRYRQINIFESILAENGVTILKFFLHISKNEQLKRLKERLTQRDKKWKVNPTDFDERKYWNDYMKAYESALSRCSTKCAPWFIIPSDKKWFRNLAVSQIIVEALESLKMKFPAPAYDLSRIMLK
jgi:PPK2 family polyphosphate:nucleotide phosphotransferase